MSDIKVASGSDYLNGCECLIINFYNMVPEDLPNSECARRCFVDNLLKQSRSELFPQKVEACFYRVHDAFL